MRHVFHWRDASKEEPSVEGWWSDRVLIVPKSSGDFGEAEIGYYLGGDRWEYAHTSPEFTTDSVAYWAYIPEPPNE